MSNRALRELRSLPLFQWEGSARSSEHPAHGELLNMPTYDASTFSRRTRRLRSHAVENGASQPSSNDVAVKAKERAKKRPAPSSVSGCTGSGGKENGSNDHSIPARNCLGPVTPSSNITIPAQTPTALAAPVSSDVADDVSLLQAAAHLPTGSKAAEPSEESDFSEGPKMCTPQPIMPCLPQVTTPSTVSPVLNTPSVGGSTARGTSNRHAQSDSQTGVAHSSHCAVVLMSTRPDTSTTVLRPDANVTTSQHKISTSDYQALHECTACAASEFLFSKQHEHTPGPEDATQAFSDSGPSASMPLPAQSESQHPVVSPGPSDVPLASGVFPHSASDNHLGVMVPSPAHSAPQEVPDDSAQLMHDGASNEAQCFPPPPSEPPQKLASAVHVHINDAPPSSGPAVTQDWNLEILASVAANIAPAEDKVPTALATARSNEGAVRSQAAARPGVHSQPTDAHPDVCLGSNTALTLVASYLATHAYSEDTAPPAPPVTATVSPTVPSNTSPPRFVESQPMAPPARVKFATPPQPYPSGKPICDTDTVYATRSTRHRRVAAAGCSMQQQPPLKRSYSPPRRPATDLGGRQETEAADQILPVAKKSRQCFADVARTANAHLPVPNLFKPSRTLELFAPSPKLASGRAWIVTWLP